MFFPSYTVLSQPPGLITSFSSKVFPTIGLRARSFFIPTTFLCKHSAVDRPTFARYGRMSFQSYPISTQSLGQIASFVPEAFPIYKTPAIGRRACSTSIPFTQTFYHRPSNSCQIRTIVFPNLSSMQLIA